MPVFSSYWFLFSLANMGVPLLSGFPGEFFGLAAFVATNFFLVLWFGIGFYFTAVYAFMVVTRTLFGSANKSLSNLVDLDRSSQSIVAYITMFVIIFGICPDLVFSTLFLSYSGTLY
jgi:NADH-quinone oxidoreductase subunit M